MKLNNLYKDPEINNEDFPLDYMAVSINSSDKLLFGVLYIAAGIGPHPTMILLHGFPGTEQNLDMAQAFRRAGWNVLVFHYRGSWGSEGHFSFQNVLDDVKAALKYVRSDEICNECRIDRQNIVLAGHSMGGFAALLTAADDLDIKACVSIAPFDFGAMGSSAGNNNKTMTFLQEMFEESIIPLQGTTAEALINESIANGEKWMFVNNVKKLLAHNILLIAAGRDSIAVPELHYYPLLNAMLSNNAGNFEYHLLDSDHSFQDKRIKLTEIIESWLENFIQPCGK